MHTITPADPNDYPLMARQVASILEGERDLVVNAAQFSAFVFDALPQLNWAGFYFMRPNKAGSGEELVLGPFQGKVACVRIPVGRGVCGTAAQQRQTIVVEDVHAFPGHIACDSASESEIVVPLVKDGRLYGVFDIDSPVLRRFGEADKAGIESLVAAFLAATDMA